MHSTLPAAPELPLWDRAATWAAVDAALAEDPRPAWAPWLGWALAWSEGRRQTAHVHLVAALASEQLTAASLSWWRAQTPAKLDDSDALLDAWTGTSAPRTRALLALALSLNELELSCPVPVVADGSCRLSNADTALLRRDPIALEQSQRWADRAAELLTEIPFEAGDLAGHALLVELELAADTPDYEALLSAHMPRGLSFDVEDWRHDAGVPEWEAIYADQVARREASQASAQVFFRSYAGCTRSLSEHHAELLERANADQASLVLLREARLNLAIAESAFDDGSLAREQRRRWSEGEWTRVCSVGDSRDSVRGRAQATLERCVKVGRERGQTSEIVEACSAELEQLDAEQYPELAEFVPKPHRSTRIHSYGVVGPS